MNKNNLNNITCTSFLLSNANWFLSELKLFYLKKVAGLLLHYIARLHRPRPGREWITKLKSKPKDHLSDQNDYASQWSWMYRHRHLEYEVPASQPLSYESFYLLKGELTPAHFVKCELTFLSLWKRAMVVVRGRRLSQILGVIKLFIISVFTVICYYIKIKGWPIVYSN